MRIAHGLSHEWHHLWNDIAEELEHNLAGPLRPDINIKEY